MVLEKKKSIQWNAQSGQDWISPTAKKKKFLPLFSQLQWKLIVKTWQDLDSYN